MRYCEPHELGIAAERRETKRADLKRRRGTIRQIDGACLSPLRPEPFANQRGYLLRRVRICLSSGGVTAKVVDCDRIPLHRAVVRKRKRWHHQTHRMKIAIGFDPSLPA